MRHAMPMLLLAVAFSLAEIPVRPARAEPTNAVAAAGDSITKGFDAQSAFLCPNTDQEHYNWATSDTNGTSFCRRGSERVFSLTERVECAQQADVISPNPNQARSGAQMLKDFVNQANAIKEYVSAQPGPRATTVLLGHNDICAGRVTEFQSSCEYGPRPGGERLLSHDAGGLRARAAKGPRRPHHGSEHEDRRRVADPGLPLLRRPDRRRVPDGPGLPCHLDAGDVRVRGDPARGLVEGGHRRWADRRRRGQGARNDARVQRRDLAVQVHERSSLLLRLLPSLVADARCAQRDKSGTFYPGFF